MKVRLTKAVLLLAVQASLLQLATGQGGDLTDVTISGQHALYSTLPFWIAKKLGYFEELGLNATLIYYSAGVPQINDAAENQAWDVADSGSVPNVLAGYLNISTIGITNDESATNALVGNAKGVDEWPPGDLGLIPWGVTANSTVHYAALKCLLQQDPEATDPSNNFDYMDQGEIMGNLSDGNIDYGALWAPNVYTIQSDLQGSGIVCSGATADAIILGGLMVRDDFGAEHPDVVASIMAAWLRAVGYVKNPANRAQVLEDMASFYSESGTTLAESDMEKEIDMRPLFDVDEQVGLFEKPQDDVGPSPVDTWYTELSQFLFDNGILAEVPEASSYITDEYLDLLSNNATLYEFAKKDMAPMDGDGTTETDGSDGEDSDADGSTGGGEDSDSDGASDGTGTGDGSNGEDSDADGTGAGEDSDSDGGTNVQSTTTSGATAMMQNTIAALLLSAVAVVVRRM